MDCFCEIHGYDSKEAWQPISTAPKDEEILLFCKSFGVIAGYNSGTRYIALGKLYWDDAESTLFGVKNIDEDQPTHWMPFPKPPSEAVK